MLLRVLLLAADARQSRRLRSLFPARGVRVALLERREELTQRLAREPVDLVVAVEERLSEPLEAGVAELTRALDGPALVVLAAQEEPERRARLLAAGVRSVLYRGLSDDVLRTTLGALVERERAERVRLQRAEAGGAARGLDAIASRSPLMAECLGVARRVAWADSSLLILGETGVGKELLARAIHAESPRRDDPFVAVNLAALPEALIESELFGHERGAFTGASSARRGLFELADRGTLLLDEVGELPLHLQAKLLRVLQEREIRPVGAEEAIPLDVRLIAATHRDLAREVDEDRFRADLYYRLSVVTLRVPSLRERPEDLPQLVGELLDELALRLRRPRAALDEAALEALVAHAWPGNVRELANVLERAALLCDGARITLADLPEAVRGGPVAHARAPRARTAARPASAPDAAAEAFDLPWVEARRRQLEPFEREYFTRLMTAAGGRAGLAAARAGIDPRSLYDKLRALGIRKEEFRRGVTP